MCPRIVVKRTQDVRSLRWGLGALALCVAVGVHVGTTAARGTAAAVEPIVWSSVVRMIELMWPAVQQLPTAELAWRIEAHEPVLLIDTRAKEEYLVCHPPGAVWAESPAQLRAAVSKVPATPLIVLYCSVGVRSSKTAAMLMRDGGHTVATLRGSIFQCANEGRALEADGRAAMPVHPYNRVWGQLLEPRLRASGAQ